MVTEDECLFIRIQMGLDILGPLLSLAEGQIEKTHNLGSSKFTRFADINQLQVITLGHPLGQFFYSDLG